MKELIGLECSAVFNLPSHEWPIQGYPAWVVVEAVDMPMIRMRQRFGGRPIWVNAVLLKTIQALKEKERAPLWVRLLSAWCGDKHA